MDLNTLIATIVTATAALVAIIGGFLVSRVLTLSSEQTGIKRKIREINNDIYAKQEMLKRLEKNILDEDAEDFILDNYKDLVFMGKSLEDILLEDKYTSRNLEELKPYVDELFLIKDDLYRLMENTDDFDDDFDQFIKNSQMKFPHRKNWYDLLYTWFIDELKKKQQPIGPFSNMRINITPPTTGLINHANVQEYREKKRDRDRLKDDITVLILQKDEQNKILYHYGKPKGMWWGLFVLFYACIVGIAYPSTLLPYPKDVYDDELTKWFLLGLFFSQLSFLFVYLGIYMHILTKEDSETI
jgi:hypothetical protein